MHKPWREVCLKKEYGSPSMFDSFDQVPKPSTGQASDSSIDLLIFQRIGWPLDVSNLFRFIGATTVLRTLHCAKLVPRLCRDCAEIVPRLCREVPCQSFQKLPDVKATSSGRQWRLRNASMLRCFDRLCRAHGRRVEVSFCRCSCRDNLL